MKEYFKLVIFFIIITAFVFLYNLQNLNMTFAENLSVQNNESKSNELYIFSKNIVKFIDENKYELAIKELNSMSNTYLKNNSRYDFPIEAHKVYSEQLIIVKTELTKFKLDQKNLKIESIRLLLASEVMENKELKLLSKHMSKLNEKTKNLLVSLNDKKYDDMQVIIDDIEKELYLLGPAMQIIYPIEYYNQILSIINYLNSLETNQLAETTPVIEHLYFTVEKLNRYTKETNVRLLYPSMKANSYILGVSIIIALSIMIIFRRNLFLFNK